MILPLLTALALLASGAVAAAPLPRAIVLLSARNAAQLPATLDALLMDELYEARIDAVVRVRDDALAPVRKAASAWLHGAKATLAERGVARTVEVVAAGGELAAHALRGNASEPFVVAHWPLRPSLGTRVRALMEHAAATPACFDGVARAVRGADALAALELCRSRAPQRRVDTRTAHMLATRDHAPSQTPQEGEVTLITHVSPTAAPAPAVAAASAYYAMGMAGDTNTHGCPADGVYTTPTMRYAPGDQGLVADLDELDNDEYDPAHAQFRFNFGRDGVPLPAPGASGTLTLSAVGDFNIEATEAIGLYTGACACANAGPQSLAIMLGRGPADECQAVVSEQFALDADALAALTVGGELAVLAHALGAVDPCNIEDEDELSPFVEVTIEYSCVPQPLPPRPAPVAAAPLQPCAATSTPFSASVLAAPSNGVLTFTTDDTPVPNEFVALDFGTVPPPFDASSGATLTVDAYGPFGSLDAYLMLFDGSGRCAAGGTQLPFVMTLFEGDESTPTECDAYNAEVSLSAAQLHELIGADGRLRLLALSNSDADSTSDSSCTDDGGILHYVRASIEYDACGGGAAAEAGTCDAPPM